MQIDQLVPGFAKFDAIGTSTVLLRDALRAAGIGSDIFAEVIDPRVAGQARPYREAPADPDRVLLYHASTHSEMVPWMLRRAAAGQTVLVCYHNITPPSYFARWEPTAARSMERAREELRALAGVTTLAIGVSSFNADELAHAGFARTAASPLLVDLGAYHQAPSARAVARLQRRREQGGPELLFVGRIAPNKCQHDVIAAFAVYRRLFQPAAHLSLVGGATSVRYLRALEEQIAELGLTDAVDLLDNLGFPDLLARFAVADAFVCLSEHEGFCVPVVEAMELGVPVLAYASSALPETVDGGGVLLRDKDPLAVACAIDSVVGDAAGRRQLVAAGRERAAAFALERTSAQMVSTLTGVLEAA